MSTVINCVTYEAGKRRAELDLKEACPADSAGNFTWVGLHEPNKELLRTVQQRFALHDLAIEGDFGGDDVVGGRGYDGNRKKRQKAEIAEFHRTPLAKSYHLAGRA